MLNQLLVAFCLIDVDGCPLQRLMSKTVASAPSPSPEGRYDDTLDTLLGMSSGIAGRVVSVGRFDEEGYNEIWMRVSGLSCYLDMFENKMKQEEGISFQKMFSNKFNTLYRIVIEKEKCPCSRRPRYCPLLGPVPGAMIKSAIITPYGILCEFMVSKTKVLAELRKRGCKILLTHELNGYEYMLTQKQELAMIYAYLMGYYQFPRRVSLKELASKLGLSVSTLAELLRKAEAKVVDAYIRHEMPHYLAGLIMNKALYKDLLESRFNNKEKEEKREEQKVVVETTA